MVERGVPISGLLSIWFHGGLRSNPSRTPGCDRTRCYGGKGKVKKVIERILHVLKIWEGLNTFFEASD